MTLCNVLFLDYYYYYTLHAIKILELSVNITIYIALLFCIETGGTMAVREITVIVGL